MRSHTKFQTSTTFLFGRFEFDGRWVCKVIPCKFIYLSVEVKGEKTERSICPGLILAVEVSA